MWKAPSREGFDCRCRHRRPVSAAHRSSNLGLRDEGVPPQYRYCCYHSAIELLHAIALAPRAKTCNACRLLLSYGKAARPTSGGTQGTASRIDAADLGAPA